MHRLGHLQSLAGWDQAANMPPKGNEARAAAMAEMAALLHRMRTDPSLADSIARAEQEPLSDLQRANLREIRRDWRRANALPESLVQRQPAGRLALRARLAHAAPGQRLGGLSRQLPRGAGDSRARKPRCCRERNGVSRYDALMDRYRARHDQRHRSTACSATCGNGCRG